MLRKLLLAFAVLGLVACGGGSKKKKTETKEEAASAPVKKEAASKLLSWSVPDDEGVSYEKRHVKVTESWLAERAKRPVTGAATFEAHDRGARLKSAPKAGALPGMGFKAGDVLVTVDGHAITPDNAVAHIVGGLIIDEEVEAVVQRETKTGSWVEGKIKFSVDQGDSAHGSAFVKPTTPGEAYTVSKHAAKYAFATGGLYTPDTTKFTAVDNGVKLAGVGPKSLMRALGFQSGDIITEIAGGAPTAPDASWAEKESIAVKVKRKTGDATLTYTLK